MSDSMITALAPMPLSVAVDAPEEEEQPSHQMVRLFDEIAESTLYHYMQLVRHQSMNKARIISQPHLMLVELIRGPLQRHLLTLANNDPKLASDPYVFDIMTALNIISSDTKSEYYEEEHAANARVLSTMLNFAYTQYRVAVIESSFKSYFVPREQAMTNYTERHFKVLTCHDMMEHETFTPLCITLEDRFFILRATARVLANDPMASRLLMRSNPSALSVHGSVVDYSGGGPSAAVGSHVVSREQLQQFDRESKEFVNACTRLKLKVDEYHSMKEDINTFTKVSNAIKSLSMNGHHLEQQLATSSAMFARSTSLVQDKTVKAIITLLENWKDFFDAKPKQNTANTKIKQQVDDMIGVLTRFTPDSEDDSEPINTLFENALRDWYKSLEDTLVQQQIKLTTDQYTTSMDGAVHRYYGGVQDQVNQSMASIITRCPDTLPQSHLDRMNQVYTSVQRIMTTLGKNVDFGSSPLPSYSDTINGGGYHSHEDVIQFKPDEAWSKACQDAVDLDCASYILYLLTVFNDNPLSTHLDSVEEQLVLLRDRERDMASNYTRASDFLQSVACTVGKDSTVNITKLYSTNHQSKLKDLINVIDTTHGVCSVHVDGYLIQQETKISHDIKDLCSSVNKSITSTSYSMHKLYVNPPSKIAGVIKTLRESWNMAVNMIEVIKTTNNTQILMDQTEIYEANVCLQQIGKHLSVVESVPVQQQQFPMHIFTYTVFTLYFLFIHLKK